jgi:c-di-GMP-binding flagellar brake protein YcgR
MTDDEHAPPLRLAIGTPLNIQILTDINGARFNARVLGMLEGASVIAHLLNAQERLRVGDKLSVRCLEGKSISGFKSTVIEVCDTPYPHFHLSYPSKLDRVEVRQSERVAVAIPVTVRTAGGASVPAEVRDLSTSGALLVASAAVGEPGELVELALPIASGQMSRMLAMKASVRNSGALSHTPGSAIRYRCGLQFLELADADRLFLLGFVYERVSAARGLLTAEGEHGPDGA